VKKIRYIAVAVAIAIAVTKILHFFLAPATSEHHTIAIAVTKIVTTIWL
jgi:hypothetical protein